MKQGSRSLQRKLTRRMIFVQMLSLAVFFGLGVFPIVIYPALNQVGTAQTLDPAAGRLIADSLDLTEEGELNIVRTPELVQMLSDHPGMYFYVQTPAGASASMGTLPPSSTAIIPNIATIDTLEVRSHGDHGSFIVRNEQSAVGPIHVLIGNGPMIGIANLLRNTAIAVAQGLWLVLTLASMIAIPYLVRREMRGLQLAADDAASIDFDTRGRRLREEGLPEEVLPLVTAVSGALTRLDQSYASRQRFLAAAAHEVRTPIAILQMRLEQSQPFPERQRVLLDVARLSALAEELLELQRIEQSTVVLAPLNVLEVVEEVVADLAPLAISSGYEIAVNSAEGVSPVAGDERSLYRAIANLVQNAITYAGGCGQILVSVAADGEVAVEDAGKGIPEGERARIFEPFQRLHHSAGGTGLGLTLVQAIMSLHGGSVSVTSSPSGGAKFTLQFPRMAAPSQEAAPAGWGQG